MSIDYGDHLVDPFTASAVEKTSKKYMTLTMFLGDDENK
jgi:hypothetical protein